MDGTAKPKDNPQNTAQSSEGTAVSITSIGLLVAPLLTILAGLALTGTIGRVQRESPGLLSLAIGLVIFAGVFWVAASTFTAPKGTEKRSNIDIGLRVAAMGLAGVGFILALAVAVATANNEPRPRVSAAVSDDGKKLTTEVEASNLPTDHRLAFRIDLLEGGEISESVYRAYVGPDNDGNVDQTITTLLPPGQYSEVGIKAYTGTTSASCDDFAAVRAEATYGSGTGCVILRVTPPADPPDPAQDPRQRG
jgi:hypothetical protein